jgi:hypothetical protein
MMRIGQLLGPGLHFLQADHIWLFGKSPMQGAFAKRGADPIHVPGDNVHDFSIGAFMVNFFFKDKNL